MAAYFIKHTKAESIKFVGHLDLQRALQRNVSRAGLNVAFSSGYSPHMQMSSAQPLSVGMSSRAEYLYVELVDAPPAEEIQRALNETAPDGIRYPSVRQVNPGTPKPMALLALVETRVKLPSTEAFATQLKSIMESDSPMMVETTNKKGLVRQKDIRPLILPGAQVIYKEGHTELTLKTMAGNPNHLNLNHFIGFIKDNTSGLAENRFIHLERLEMFALKDGHYVSLGDF